LTTRTDVSKVVPARADSIQCQSLYPADERLLEKAIDPRSNRGTLLLYYNFARAHQTLRVTPPMEADISDGVSTIEEIVGLLG
jgi:hypothetical protein